MGLKKCYLHLCDLSALVVTSQNGDSVLEAHLQAHQQRHCLHAVVATIDIVAHEQVVCIRRTSTNLKQFHQVVELAMNVTTDGDWALDGLDIHFSVQDFFSLKESQEKSQHSLKHYCPQ